MINIKTILKEINDLTPIPQVAHRILSLARDPESSMTDVSDVIAHDAAVTANLLKVANSAYFGLSGKFDSVHQAIVYLGMNQVVDLVLLASGSDNLKKAQKGYDLESGELWKYSVSSALISRDLSENIKAAESSLIFTAALLKDIGKVVLNQYVGDYFDKINSLVLYEGYSFGQAEKEIIGIDHSELGGIVAETWKFSPKMVDIIRHHHNPEKSTLAPLECSIVHIADMLCMMLGIGVGSDGLAYKFHKNVADKLGLTQIDFQEILAGFGEKLERIESLVTIS